MINWHLETRKLADLKDHPKNPRKLDKDQAEHLQKSLEKFGLIDKPIINLDNQIIGGHQRKNVLKKMKLKQIECFVPDHMLTPEEVDELNIRLNRNTGDWDWDILANQWDTEQLIDWGFKAEEFLGASVEEIMGEDEEDSEMLQPAADPITKLGDVYELNSHRIVCGDSTLPEYVNKCLAGAEPVLMVTDPPYNLASENDLIAKDCSKAMKNLSESEWDKNFDISIFLNVIEEYLKNNFTLYIFTSHHLAPEIWFWMKSFCGFHSWCVWEKPNPMPSLMKRHWTWNTELVCYGTKGKHIFNFPMEGHANPVWKVNKNNEKTGHPTEKPTELLKIPIEYSSNKNDLLFDPFLGSGTTLIAAEQLGRICYGIELDPAYCDIVVERWKKYMQKNNRTFTIKKNGEIING